MAVETQLFYDTFAGGHHGEFFENLICGIPKKHQKSKVILAHPDLEERLTSLKKIIGANCQLVFLTKREVIFLESSQGIVQLGRRQLNVLDKYLRQFKATRVFLMHMNSFQYVLHRWKPPISVEISGILLSPFTPIDRAYGVCEKFNALVMGIRKRLQLKLMLQNHAIKKIFLLNDERVAGQLNRWGSRRQVFESITDPLPALWPTVTAVKKNIEKTDGIYRFLLAGEMSGRKGCIETLDCLSNINLCPGQCVEVRLLGRFSKRGTASKDRILAKIKEVEKRCAFIRIYVKDSFLSNEEMSEEFKAADCILAPYVKFYGSSGMIGHACRFRKPLLSCRSGLLGEIVSTRCLGLCINPHNGPDFANGIMRIINGNYEYDFNAAESYVAEADHKIFAEHLIS